MRGSGSPPSADRLLATLGQAVARRVATASADLRGLTMPDHVSLLDELRVQYETTRQSTSAPIEVEGFQAIDARLHKAFRWLEKAVAYLDGIKPPINHRFDLGHGFVFESPRFGHGYIGQHSSRIVGFPVIDEINVYYEIAAQKPLTIEVAPGGVTLVEKTLEAAALQYTSRRVEAVDGSVRKCSFSVPPAIQAAVLFRVDYQTAQVTVTLVNVDRFDRTVLIFPSKAIDEPVLEDLVRLILGRDDAFLRHAALAGIHGRAPGAG